MTWGVGLITGAADSAPAARRDTESRRDTSSSEIFLKQFIFCTLFYCHITVFESGTDGHGIADLRSCRAVLQQTEAYLQQQAVPADQRLVAQVDECRIHGPGAVGFPATITNMSR